MRNKTNHAEKQWFKNGEINDAFILRVKLALKAASFLVLIVESNEFCPPSPPFGATMLISKAFMPKKTLQTNIREMRKAGNTCTPQRLLMVHSTNVFQQIMTVPYRLWHSFLKPHIFLVLTCVSGKFPQSRLFVSRYRIKSFWILTLHFH